MHRPLDRLGLNDHVFPPGVRQIRGPLFFKGEALLCRYAADERGFGVGHVGDYCILPTYGSQYHYPHRQIAYCRYE